MKRLTTTAAFLLMSAGMSFAAINTDAVIADLQAQGYTSIEVKTGLTQIKVEAVRGTETMEVIYDKATGTVLKSEAGVVTAGDDTAPGVSLSDEDKDFLGSGRATSGGDDSDSDDNGNDDDGDDGGDDDNGGDDDGGDDDGDDDNGNDDNGGDDNDSDDDGDDDNGDDDNDSDD